MNKRFFVLGVLLNSLLLSSWAQDETPKEEPEKEQKIEMKSYSWINSQPLGTREIMPADSSWLDFYQTDLLSAFSLAQTYTGALGAPTYSLLFFDRPLTSEFYFVDPYYKYHKPVKDFRFYNSTIPFTKLDYHTAGSKINATEDLSVILSGNMTPKLQFGVGFDLIFTKGDYLQQATKDLSYQLFGSYIGDRYEAQVYIDTENFKNQENGGIVNDNYILRPEEFQGNQNNIDPRSIPVNLNQAYNRVRSQIFYGTQRYSLGFEKEVITPKDTTTVFVPVTSFIHTIEAKTNERRFEARAQQPTEGQQPFFKNNYFTNGDTNDHTTYWSLQNTLGVSLREGFNKYAKMGLAAYLTYDFRHYNLMPDTLKTAGTPSSTRRNYNENIIWAGAELSKKQGAVFTYNIDGKIGLSSSALGDIDVNGYLQTRFRLFKDTVQVRAFSYFKNIEPSFLYKKYSSNHFYWENDFGKIRRLKIGGDLDFPTTGTRFNATIENIQNYIYFDKNGLPTQESDMIQVMQLKLMQNFHFGIFNLNAIAALQESSNAVAIPLPRWSFYANMFLKFKIAKVMDVQLGADCRYYSAYKSMAYQPATLAFYSQDEVFTGDYPLMNIYANMKLQQVKFYVLYSHANQGLFGGKNYFSMPHYPINAPSLQLGLSIDLSD